MDPLNTTLNLAKQTVQNLNLQNGISNETSTLDRQVLTKIMITDTIIDAYDPNASPESIQYIQENFTSIYSLIGKKAGQPVTIQDGINAMKYIINLYYSTLSAVQDSDDDDAQDNVNENNDDINILSNGSNSNNSNGVGIW